MSPAIYRVPVTDILARMHREAYQAAVYILGAPVIRLRTQHLPYRGIIGMHGPKHAKATQPGSKCQTH